jgi:hypothetical protein
VQNLNKKRKMILSNLFIHPYRSVDWDGFKFSVLELGGQRMSKMTDDHTVNNYSRL